MGARQTLSIIVPKGNYNLLVQEKSPVSVKGDETESTRYVKGFGEIREAVKEPLNTYLKQIKVGDDQLFFVGMGDGKIGYTFTRGNVEPVRQEDKFRGGFYKEGKLEDALAFPKS